MQSESLEEPQAKERQSAAEAVSRSSRTRPKKVAGADQINSPVLTSPVPANTSNQPHRDSKPVPTVSPSPSTHSQRKGTKLPRTDLAKKTAIKPVLAPQSHPGSKKGKATSNTRPPTLGLQVPVLLVSVEASASTTETQITQTQESSAAAPTTSMALLQVTDPKEIASRKELLDVPHGHMLIHLLLHATAWSQYILVIVYS